MPMSSCEEPDIDFEIVKRFRGVLQANCELSDPTRSKISVSEPKKLRPALGGELAARDPVWDGEGWGCDRVAGPVIPLLSVIAGTGGGGRRPVITQRVPDIRIAL
jgi:hypothetical protein